MASENGNNPPKNQRKPPQKWHKVSSYSYSSTSVQRPAYRKSAFAANVFSPSIFGVQHITTVALAAANTSTTGDIFMFSVTLRLRFKHAGASAPTRSAGD
ncbi:hypothetical protein ACLEDY_11725 [Lonsdalea quercina]|uniref:hypothetical protein n=1 Tax=Lonsdalea quercina TaxID=71657 RepID=UPI003976F9AA